MSRWNELKALRAEAGERHILDLFEADPDRAEGYSVTTGDMRFDYSKTNIDSAARDGLIALCDAAGLAGRREAMFTGGKINETEGRAVLHTALRNLDGGPVMAEGQDVMPEVLGTLARMRAFADAVRSGKKAGAGGAFTDVGHFGGWCASWAAV